jgi:hypothetical protein
MFYITAYLLECIPKRPSNSQVTVLLLSSATTIFKDFLKRLVPDNFFFTQYAWLVLFDIHKTFGKKKGKFQLKGLICSIEMIFFLSACTHQKCFQKGHLSEELQTPSKCRRTWTVGRNKMLLELFCREMNAFSPGYFWKRFSRCRIIDCFYKRSVLVIYILVCPYFGGY